MDFCYPDLNKVSAVFVVLTTFLTCICILIDWGSDGTLACARILSLLYLEFFFILAFSANDLIIFFVASELTFRPMVLLSRGFSKEYKNDVFNKLLIVPVIGSLFFFVSIIIALNKFGTTNLCVLQPLLSVLQKNEIFPSYL